MFEYFYNEIFRKTIIGFGTLFNDITIKQEDSTIKVPLAYGPTQKFLARLEESPDLNKRTSLTLPRMSFEFTGLQYDATRKVTTTQQFTVKDNTTGKNTNKAYMPVPYSMQFELSIMTKLNDDALQIVEQILPYFQPQYNLTVNLLSTMKEKRDIPVILENVTMDDQYEGNFTTRRVLLYTLRFSAKTYLFGPITSATKDIIKKVGVKYMAGGSTSVERDVTYTVTPRATKDYTGDVLTNLTEDIDALQTSITVNDGSALTAETYIDIDDEQMYIKQIDSNKIIVDRGRDGRAAAAHVKGSEILGITAADDALIEMGDDFGFSGEFT
tara:strand:+ start:2763 stop:3743 length:981 start_codon:yes stop_codon:yes gene_type:complete